jgi:CheY-like chemotaxis protein
MYEHAGWYGFRIAMMLVLKELPRIGTAMKEPNILIVEDVRMIAEYMELILFHHGYRVSGVVVSGEEAVVTALKTRPDVVLMDIKLEGVIDGITAAAMIHDQSDIPIIYVTAYTDKAVFERAMSTNPSAYLHKPFKGNELIDTIQRILDGGGGVMGLPKRGCPQTAIVPSPGRS